MSISPAITRQVKGNSKTLGDIIEEYNNTTNPVTRVSLRDCIRDRIERLQAQHLSIRIGAFIRTKPYLNNPITSSIINNHQRG